ncbi:6-phosphofructokinase [Candidatus Scalindua japonica]|uniref:Pyrophosphate--fructose 6-phosphate 1-phosphotransferase n=1 Tax=Candidatus Scalindua japonica TaxID=1284222 RepID=A0A286TXZ5_9BACT|nr:ATP-dependent 6-phosphofructokinase [Candidatus Scalindua japonica]GAX60746.1 6-phosphofructokinase [Candidatus Scalindua japonica]
MKKIGILTGGGDCPGLNATIRAVVRKGIKDNNYKMYGILEGWKGLIEGNIKELDMFSVSGILPRGGTILGTSRTNPFGEGKEKDQERILDNIKALGLYAIVAIGGDDTQGVAYKLSEMGVNVIGIPKTIDNDILCTDYTFGFDTAVNIVMDAIDRLHTTAESHNRVMVVEVMGRHAGWIATFAGIAGGADIIMIPEKPLDMEDVYKSIIRRHKSGKNFSIVVVSEGVKISVADREKEGFALQSNNKDDFGHVMLGGIGSVLANLIEKRTGFETRNTVLGHTQRGGSPTAFDRILSTRFGVAAMESIDKGEFGKIVVLKGNEIISVDLKDVIGQNKIVDDYWYDIAKVFFG